MGSRTEWIIKDSNSEVAIHLYSHWGGESKFVDTQRALTSALPRWSDISYGVRIFISQIVADDWASETGFGIAVGSSSEAMFEESYFNAVIDFVNQRVEFGEHVWSFEDFIILPDLQEQLTNEFWGVDA